VEGVKNKKNGKVEKFDENGVKIEKKPKKKL